MLQLSMFSICLSLHFDYFRANLEGLSCFKVSDFLFILILKDQSLWEDLAYRCHQ